ncbi:hypothetical protein [Stenoxybacter acetivorans]|uniref:hypothetical protein n=1 Tax=Stenoxybacter acetivorans TaxID=422441 RepID=UPI0005616F6A|nr:hypothetical protein [Stenoxybacter acetivorans]
MTLIFLKMVAAFFGCIIVFVLIAYIVGSISKVWCGILTFFILFGLMFGHDIYVIRQFNHLCSSAGDYIYRKEKVDGFYRLRTNYQVTSFTFDDIAKSYLNQGYSYIEAKEFTGERLATGRWTAGEYVFYRFSYDKNGNFKKERIPELKSDYEYSSEVNIRVSEYIDKSEEYVKNRHTGELLGVSRDFIALGGKFMGYFFRDENGHAYMGTGNDCHIKVDISKSLPEAVLIPNKSLH